MSGSLRITKYRASVPRISQTYDIETTTAKNSKSSIQTHSTTVQTTYKTILNDYIQGIKKRYYNHDV